LSNAIEEREVCGFVLGSSGLSSEDISAIPRFINFDFAVLGLAVTYSNSNRYGAALKEA
jgi:hypothetical protein